MTHRVLISAMLNAFVNAHDALVSKLGGRGFLEEQAGDNYNDYIVTIECNWKKEYNNTLKYEHGVWKYVDFPNERAYIMFVLRWS